MEAQALETMMAKRPKARLAIHIRDSYENSLFQDKISLAQICRKTLWLNELTEEVAGRVCFVRLFIS